MTGLVEIPLTRGFVAIVDPEDAARVLSMGKWHADVQPWTTYAKKDIRRDDGRRTTIRMHTAITGWPLTDHINGDGLDNRRANLRRATSLQNNRNLRRPRHNTSGYTGVTRHAKTGRWQVRIYVDGRSLHLGLFTDLIEAAKVWDEAALHYRGEFARLNFPEATR